MYSLPSPTPTAVAEQNCSIPGEIKASLGHKPIVVATCFQEKDIK